MIGHPEPSFPTHASITTSCTGEQAGKIARSYEYRVFKAAAGMEWILCGVAGRDIMCDGKY
jgi:hypothetical protein